MSFSRLEGKSRLKPVVSQVVKAGQLVDSRGSRES